MFKKTLIIAAASISTLAYAEPQRALFTHENKFPELKQVEVGALGNYTEYDTRDERAIGPYVRYGLIKNLTVSAGIPFRAIHPDFGDSESGFGDMEIGLELRAWEDIFEYPYVIPHVEQSFQTGDEDKGTGASEAVTTIGISIGTVTHEVLHWVADGSYAINGGAEQPDPDNVFILSGSIIWDISKQFAVLFEASATDEDNQEDETPAIYQGGLVYKWTDDFVTSFYFGGANGGANNADGIATVKVAYTF